MFMFIITFYNQQSNSFFVVFIIYTRQVMMITMRVLAEQNVQSGDSSLLQYRTTNQTKNIKWKVQQNTRIYPVFKYIPDVFYFKKSFERENYCWIIFLSSLLHYFIITKFMGGCGRERDTLLERNKKMLIKR